MRIPYAFAVALAAALAAAGVVGMQAMAQQSPRQTEEAAPLPQASPDNNDGPRERRGWRDRARMSDEDRTAFLAARLAAVRAGLLLSPEQDRLWPAVEDAARNMIGVARDWRSRMRSAAPPADRLAQMRRMGEFAKARGEALVRLADAAEPLYATLSDDQKRRLRILMRRSGLEGIAGGAMGGGRHMDRQRGDHMDHRFDGGRGGRQGDMRGRMDGRMRHHEGRYHRDHGGYNQRDGRDGPRHLRQGTDWSGDGFDRGAFIEDWRTL